MAKIGIDLHGVLNRDPKILKETLVRTRQDGNEIFVISGPPREEILQELKYLQYSRWIHYDHVISVVDWLKHNGYSEYMKQHDNGNWYTEAKYWWSAKGKICKQNDIYGIFDDSLEYKPTCEELGVLYVYYPEFRKETRTNS